LRKFAVKNQSFPFRKRHHIAVAFTMVVASVIIGCTRAQGTFPDLWGPDRITFKDAAGKVTNLVRGDKNDGAESQRSAQTASAADTPTIFPTRLSH
jgi:hypothetical protein